MLILPAALREDIRMGRVVLFLGAGASLGAKDSMGNQPPLAPQLRDILADQFLGGKYKDSPLAWVAELAISETDLATVQDFIADILNKMEPAPFHLTVPTFRWRGIVTVNYDRIIEAAYSKGSRIQELVPFLSDRDRIDEKLRSPNHLALLKLHGCVTRTHETELPLILTVDQYVTHRGGRERLFRTLEEWALEYPIVFIGHGGQDPDLRAILLEVSKDLAIRPRYYLVRPGVGEPEIRFWESKRITVLSGTFEDLITTLEKEIPAAIRPLLAVASSGRPIQRRFALHEQPGSVLESFLDNDVDYVHPSISTPEGTPQAFYRGFDLGWYPIIKGLDVRRNLADRLLIEVVIRAEQERPTATELYVIKAEAGAGKSVFLRRLAWEASSGADVLCLFLRDFGILRYEPVRELYRLTQQRIFIFVDGAAERAQALESLLSDARRDRLPITVFTAERLNTWNIACDRLESYLTDSFQLRYLSHEEIVVLVGLLREHDSLGPELTGKTTDECVRQFEQRAGRQLLVALHEATLGAPFEDILLDEYESIQPSAARQLYLTVCVLNRLSVPVRAGLIARVHGIRFEEFRERLFAPLEHVVSASQHPGTQDYLYAARHPEIAQIVFDRALRSITDRFNEYVRILGQLNLAYSTDRLAFRGLLRAKALRELFSDHQMVQEIFRIAAIVGNNEAYLFQQEANYERIRPNGNYIRAEQLLQHARELDPRDFTIVHTLAELKRTRAENAPHALEREKHRNEARALLTNLLGDQRNGRYARHTLLKLAVDELRDLLDQPNSSERQIDNAIRSAENLLQRGLQEYPGDEYLLTAESDFSQLLRDHQRSFDALCKAFEANRRDPYIASRLAKTYQTRGELENARDTLHTALESNRGDKQLNFLYGKVLRESNVTDCATLVYHFRRAFTKGDSNYEAQFWFARYAFESTNEAEHKESKEVFRQLRNAPIPNEVRSQVRDILRMPSGSNRNFTGTITRIEWTHGFVQRDGKGDWVFFHRSNTPEDLWPRLASGTRVSFEIGFNFSGAIALELRPT